MNMNLLRMEERWIDGLAERTNMMHDNSSRAGKKTEKQRGTEGRERRSHQKVKKDQQERRERAISAGIRYNKSETGNVGTLNARQRRANKVNATIYAQSTNKIAEQSEKRAQDTFVTTPSLPPHTPTHPAFLTKPHTSQSSHPDSVSSKYDRSNSSVSASRSPCSPHPRPGRRRRVYRRTRGLGRL